MILSVEKKTFSADFLMPFFRRERRGKNEYDPSSRVSKAYGTDMRFKVKEVSIMKAKYHLRI